ncbi:MAG: hypothetical protein WA815_14955, partial [Terracidiphilus sp.]
VVTNEVAHDPTGTHKFGKQAFLAWLRRGSANESRMTFEPIPRATVSAFLMECKSFVAASCGYLGLGSHNLGRAAREDGLAQKSPLCEI